ncbi:family 43 glycosylhydrolase [Lederbergia graminis]|uniref:Family 43 glycosylhydrolase n=1 Tax=Lederbergia graminis TaxID=735518 RepID=A0ABW0LF61_9BACI
MNFFQNPIMDGADPFITYKDGYYYLVCTEVKHISIWRSKSLSGIANGERKIVFTPQPNKANSTQIWAPELHWINGKWFIYYTVTNDEEVYNHRMFVLESETDDALGHYIDRGVVEESNDKWAIDGTVLEMDNGELYFIWSGFKENDWPQKLYIASLDRNEPWKLLSERILLSETTLPWEGSTIEGPQILRKNGKLMIIFSADDAGSDRYKLGMLTFTGTDPLNPNHWVKHPTPLFGTYMENNVYSPGHGNFTKSPDGKEDWMIYHAAMQKGAGYNRNIRMQPFSWNDDDTPNFGVPLSTETKIKLPSGEI